MHRLLPTVTGIVVLICLTSNLCGAEPEWSGRAPFRLLVEVPDVPVGDRDQDTAVASLDVDFPALLAARNRSGQFDPSSLHIHRYDAGTGRAEMYHDGTFAGDPRDCPCRFDDALSSRSDLSRVGSAIDSPDGLVPGSTTPRKARLFNREPASTAGNIVWTHTQSGETAAHYAIYFDVINSSVPLPVGPAPWIGDVDVLRRETGESLGGFAHFTVATGDLNGDTLFDLVAGCEKGDVMWFPNRGAADTPRFQGCALPEDQHGPIDCGWYAAPFVYDWNDDGLPDLLCGTRTNAIVWWRNIGTPSEPRWEHVGFVQAGNERLAVPEAPVDEDPHGIFNVDYYNQPWIGDLNGDGFTDVVTGGYTTGRMFFFPGTGRDADGIPTIAPPVSVDADGQPIDTVWAAAPVLHDVDNDGLLDLITGSWFWTGIPRAPLIGEGDFLAYYANVGTPTHPKFSRRPFPKRGEFPSGSIARPCVVDFNADGLTDLLVSDNAGNVYAFPNVGTPDAPMWDVSVSASEKHAAAASLLTVPWGFAKHLDVSLPTADLDRDGTPDFVIGNQVYSLKGGIHAPTVVRHGTAVANGAAIDHPGPGYGDGYFYTWLADWNNDGRTDLLWGTQQGNVYLHRKTGDDLASFQEGELLTLSTGEPLKVGPPVVATAAEATDFTILQGSRILMATEDFDCDGRLDLIVSETYGNVWLFRRVEADGRDTLAPGVLLAKLPGRTESLNFDDWNHDGLPDLLLGGTTAEPVKVLLNSSRSGQPGLEPPQTVPGLPYVFWGAKPRVADWNGDGDADLLIQSEFFSFFAERSFLEGGYREGRLVSDGILARLVSSGRNRESP